MMVIVSISVYAPSPSITLSTAIGLVVIPYSTILLGLPFMRSMGFNPFISVYELFRDKDNRKEVITVIINNTIILLGSFVIIRKSYSKIREGI